MEFEWHKPRSYRHLDRPVGREFLERILDAKFVAQHSFSPLIYYSSEVRRYKPGEKKTIERARPIMYASHKDAAVLSYYAQSLSSALEAYYQATGITENVIAYRALGKANYDFSAEALRFAEEHSPCSILAFDVTGFFDNLNHGKLKARLKSLLGVNELPPDWYNVFRAMTKFRFVSLEEMKAKPELAGSFQPGARGPISTVEELKALGITFRKNGTQLAQVRDPNSAGIPQGTPISAMASNAYMIEFDRSMKSFCDSIGALYRRYSDDILVICGREDETAVAGVVSTLLEGEELQLSQGKTETTRFDSAEVPSLSSRFAQYLGFSYYPGGAGMRASSLARQWRKMRRAVRKAKGKAAKGNGILHTRKLRKRFSLIVDQNVGMPLRSFPAYARRSAQAFGGGEKITRQAAKLQKAMNRLIMEARKDL